MEFEQAKVDYFNRGKIENPYFWWKLGGKPSFKGKTVLEVGCGHGSLCIDMALSGAKRVIGLDIDGERIAFAQRYLKANYPDLAGRVAFVHSDIRDYETNQFFDYIISKDSFEHFIEIEDIFDAMKARLRPRGRLYIGFGPLYNSPFGAHRRSRVMIPWGHLLLPEWYIVQQVNKHREDKVSSIQELGLNQWSLRKFRHLFENSGLEIVAFRVNSSNRLISKIFRVLRKLPLLKEYFTHNLYCILEASGGQAR